MKQKKTWTRQADNRERLIAAGFELISEKGIEATTIKEIARLADVSPGLFHYYFSSKDELLLAVLYKTGTQFKERMEQGLQTISERDFPTLAMVMAKELGGRDPSWHRLRYELYALGLRNPDFLSAIGTFLATARHEMTQIIMHFTGMEERQAQAAAAVALACFDGLALQQMAQSDLDFSAAYALLSRLFLNEPST